MSSIEDHKIYSVVTNRYNESPLDWTEVYPWDTETICIV